jgi:hypothetical protein
MANSMNNNNSFNNWGGNSGWGNGMGMAGFPMLGGLGGMGGWPGMSPWSGYGGGLPANGMGMSPWSYSQGGSPWSSAWGNPFMGGMSPALAPGAAHAPYPGVGYGGYPEDYSDTALLEGRWYGISGDVLEFRGNRFRLMAGQLGITGVVRVDNNILSLYSSDTDTLTQYTFVRNQTELLLQDVTGEVLAYRRYPFGYTF